MRQFFEYAVLPHVPSWNWDSNGPPPSPSQFKGKLSAKNEKKIALMQSIILGGEDGGPLYHFRSFSQGYWLYEHMESQDLALVRQTSTMTLNIIVRHTAEGKDRVAASTLGGRLVWSDLYGMHDACLMRDVKPRVLFVLFGADMVGPWTPIAFTSGGKLLNGNSKLKRGRKTQAWFRFWNHRLTQRSTFGQRSIRKYMVRKASA